VRDRRGGGAACRDEAHRPAGARRPGAAAPATSYTAGRRPDPERSRAASAGLALAPHTVGRAPGAREQGLPLAVTGRWKETVKKTKKKGARESDGREGGRVCVVDWMLDGRVPATPPWRPFYSVRTACLNGPPGGPHGPRNGLRLFPPFFSLGAPTPISLSLKLLDSSSYLRPLMLAFLGFKILLTI
jgi:hypothetical protein